MFDKPLGKQGAQCIADKIQNNTVIIRCHTYISINVLFLFSLISL